MEHIQHVISCSTGLSPFRSQFNKRFAPTAAEADHSDVDCFMLVFLSHGENDHVYTFNGKISIQDITSLFKGDKCKSLVGKPKIFILQVHVNKHLAEPMRIWSCCLFFMQCFTWWRSAVLKVQPKQKTCLCPPLGMPRRQAWWPSDCLRCCGQWDKWGDGGRQHCAHPSCWGWFHHVLLCGWGWVSFEDVSPAYVSCGKTRFLGQTL